MNRTNPSVVELQRVALELDFSGAVSLAPLGSRPSLDLAAGYADRGHQVPNNIETRFAMASGSKVFTAVAVGLLIQEGKISWETQLAECVRSREFHFASGVTLKHLLNHTSGVPDYFDEEEPSAFADLWQERLCYRMTSVKDFLPLFEDKPMKASPGSRFLYSNSGYILLGLVIEELTGHDFRAFIADRIFRACGMTKTGYYSTDALPENTAMGYLSPAITDRHTNIFSLPSIGGADGGAFTTVGDMRLFWTSFLEGRLLSPEMTDHFVSPSVRVNETDESRHYGYGVWLRNMGEKKIVSIMGNDPGVSMISRVCLNDDLIVTVLSNVQDGARNISRALDEKILVERKDAMP